jgi:perosamine synthetase
MEMRIPLSVPDITEADIAAVVDVLRTPRLSIGPRMEEFEQAVAGYVGVRHAVAVSSGTAGLHLSLRALGIGEGDEVILPSFTFIAVAHAVLYERAVPVFADIDPVTLNLNPEKIEERITPRTRAIVVVHTFGYPANLGRILDIAARRDLPVIEDTCEAIGAEYRGRKTGGIGRIGVFAFYPNKPITTAEGGMLVTDDANLAETFRALRNQGRQRDTDGWFNHRLLGYNYRLSELHCALGLSQMPRLEEILRRRMDRALEYSQKLRTISEVIAPQFECPEGRICWFAFVVRLNGDFTQAHRDSIRDHMVKRSIGCERYFAPIHRQPLYARFAAGARGDLPVTEQVSARTLALPFFNALTNAQVAEVCETLREAIAMVQQRAPHSTEVKAGRST